MKLAVTACIIHHHAPGIEALIYPHEGASGSLFILFLQQVSSSLSFSTIFVQITAPMLLHVCICLCVLWLHSPAQALVTPEHEASARKLLQDNLHVSLAHWHKLRAEQGRKLTMQTFFRTAYRHLKNPHIAFWGIKNNKVYQLDKDGELRYSTDAMLQDGKPNKGAAGESNILKKVPSLSTLGCTLTLTSGPTRRP